MLVIDFLRGVLFESFRLLEKMSPYLRFGFFFAGVLRVFFSPEKVSRHLGRRAKELIGRDAQGDVALVD